MVYFELQGARKKGGKKTIEDLSIPEDSEESQDWILFRNVIHNLGAISFKQSGYGSVHWVLRLGSSLKLSLIWKQRRNRGDFQAVARRNFSSV